MPDSNHTHPEYEKTFARVATILDVLAQDQAITDRTLREFIAEANKRDADTRATLKLLAEGLNALIARDTDTSDEINDLRKVFKERDAETTEKLNALIVLMDQHLREQGGRGT